MRQRSPGRPRTELICKCIAVRIGKGWQLPAEPLADIDRFQNEVARRVGCLVVGAHRDRHRRRFGCAAGVGGGETDGVDRAGWNGIRNPTGQA